MNSKPKSLIINELQIAFAKNTRSIIKERGISQNKLGDMLGITKKAMSDIITGNATLLTVCRVADVLEVSPFELLRPIKDESVQVQE